MSIKKEWGHEKYRTFGGMDVKKTVVQHGVVSGRVDPAWGRKTGHPQSDVQSQQDEHGVDVSVRFEDIERPEYCPLLYEELDTSFVQVDHRYGRPASVVDFPYTEREEDRCNLASL